MKGRLVARFSVFPVAAEGEGSVAGSSVQSACVTYR